MKIKMIPNDELEADIEIEDVFVIRRVEYDSFCEEYQDLRDKYKI